jgi:hypothetical protein
LSTPKSRRACAKGLGQAAHPAGWPQSDQSQGVWGTGPQLPTPNSEDILCGVSVAEITGAFVRGHAAKEKRILRAKTTLAGAKALFDVSVPDGCAERLPAVRRTLCLLFNEG